MASTRPLRSLLVVLSLLAANAALAVNVSVTSTADTNTVGTLRYAIGHANAGDVITFSIGSGLKTITLSSALPALNKSIAIDGSSQPGYAGTPLIVLDGNGLSTNGLTVFGGSTSIIGLAIVHFNGNGIEMATLGGNSVTGCYIGLAADGVTAAPNNFDGIRISTPTGNSIGGSTAVARNVISGNGAQGITLMTGGNQVTGNYIGTNAAGTAAVGNGQSGVLVTSSGNIIGGGVAGQGNVISGNATGLWVKGALVTSATVKGNLIGTNAAGTGAIPNVVGIRVTDTTGITIGGTGAGDRNVVSGNSNVGLNIDGSGSGTHLEGNYIGTNAAGSAAIPNGNFGVSVSQTGVVVGGTSAGAGNVISGNTFNGVSVYANATLLGNLIGTNAAGTAAIPNGLSGVRVVTGSGATIGGSVAGSRNVVSGNTSAGITAESGSSSVTIQGNYIGTDKNGTAAVPNGGGVQILSPGAIVGGGVAGTGNLISGNTTNGVSVAASNVVVWGNTIGLGSGGAALGNGSGGVRFTAGTGSSVGGTFASQRNVISGNGGSGVVIDAAVSSVTVAGNYIGTNAAGTAAVPNAGGVSVAGSSCTVGGTTAAAANVISGNTTDGIGISGSGAIVQGNKLGTNAAGSGAVPNGSGGVRVFAGGSGALIGGVAAGAGNVISGNTNGTGVTVDSGLTAVTIQRNIIGLDVTGATALPNAGGIRMYGTSCTIGGPSAGNTISGNTTDGISLAGTGNAVEGNYIGLDLGGTLDRGNAIGIRVYASDGNTIGGTATNLRNVISGNFRGITLEYGSTGNTILGNYIGLSASGASAVPNDEEGIAVGSPGNTIGGTTAGAGNVISGNYNGYGIWILGATAHDTKVYGNLIGTKPDGVTPLPNVFGIVVSESYSNLIGGTAAGQKNVIAGNSYEGVRIQFGSGNTISGNSIFGHAGLGIDLEPNGPATNDALDADFGANLQQNYPVLSSVTVSAGNTAILGALSSAASSKYRLEFFGGTACNPTGMGEGKTYLGSVDVNTDGAGHAAINASLPVGAPGAFVSATATSENGDTSEFSPCAAVGGPNPGTIQLGDALLVTTEADGNAYFIVTRSGGNQGAVSVHYATSDGSATAPSDYASTSGTLNFADGEVVKTIPVPLVADTDPEPQENFHFTLSSPGGGAVLGSQIDANVLLDDESLTAPYVWVSDVTITEGNSGTKIAHVPVHVSAHSGTVTVTLQTDDGSALAGEDYVAADGDVVFTAAETQKTFDVVINGDTKVEPNEAFFVRVTKILPDGYVTHAEAEIVILNDETGGLRGDANNDGKIDVSDVFFEINNLFAGGPAPVSQCLANANADGTVDVSDVFFLINYLFAGGAAPTPPNC